jgi:hypothetical protein
VSDDALPRPAHPRLLRGCALLAAAFLLAVVGACALAGPGIRRGLIDPPWIITRVGPVHLVARQTLYPQCALEFPCGRPINVLDPTLKRYYVVWVVVSLPDGSLGRYRLLAEQIRD